VRADDLVSAADKLDASREDIMDLLHRCGF